MDRIALLKKIASIADELDQRGYTKEARDLSGVMIKVSQIPDTRGTQFKMQAGTKDAIDAFQKQHNLPKADLMAWIIGKFANGQRVANDYFGAGEAANPSVGSANQNVGSSQASVNDFINKTKILISSVRAEVLGPDSTNFGGALSYLETALKSFLGQETSESNFPGAKSILGNISSFDNVKLSNSDLDSLNSALDSVQSLVEEYYNEIGPSLSLAGYVRQGALNAIGAIKAKFYQMTVAR